MSEQQKQAGEILTKAFDLLPDSKKEFLLGYAEGVAAMSEKSGQGRSHRQAVKADNERMK